MAGRESNRSASAMLSLVMTRSRLSVWYEFVTMALGIPIVYWSLLAIAALAFGCCFCGCASSESKGCLATPMGAVGE
jgi:hypothetical protein